MTEENKKEVTETSVYIMCYVSKKMVPIDETVEISYGGNKKYRVLPEYVKYQEK